MYIFHQKCLICNGGKLKHLRKYASIFLVKCSACSFVFSQKVPALDELNNYYSYERNRYISPITLNRYHELLDQFKKFRQSNNLLDVGCGGGDFLTVAKERGWNVFGTEITNEAVTTCRNKGIMMHHGNLADAAFAKNFFDVITCIEVIEHINAPLTEAQTIYSLLRTGGIAYITTPNFDSLSRYLLGKGWNVISYPDHLCYYTPKTLSSLFKNSGFVPLKIETTGFSISRMKISMNISTLPSRSHSSDDERLRAAMESNGLFRNAKRLINRLLSITQSGDSIKATFIKN